MGCGPSYHLAQLNCSYTYVDIYMFGGVCKDRMNTLYWKEWTRLQLFDGAACVLPLAGMPLLIERYICWNTVLFFICCEW